MKIFALANNYRPHNKTGDAALYNPEEPVLFTKTDSALLKDRKPFFVPDHLGRIEGEAEVVVRISRLGKNIAQRFAHRYYDAITMGIDFGAVEVLGRLREKGQSWELAKSFDGSAAIGEWVDKTLFRNIHALDFHLDTNRKTTQVGNTIDLFYGIDETIAYLSQFFTLKTGDLLFTGCPMGGQTINVNDQLTGYLGERKVLEISCK